LEREKMRRGRRSLPTEVARHILRLAKLGLSQKLIARRIGASYNTVGKVLARAPLGTIKLPEKVLCAKCRASIDVLPCPACAARNSFA
jgi:DNA invertase Pin-like site-specific DNA recombinase